MSDIINQIVKVLKGLIDKLTKNKFIDSSKAITYGLWVVNKNSLTYTDTKEATKHGYRYNNHRNR